MKKPDELEQLLEGKRTSRLGKVLKSLGLSPEIERPNLGSLGWIEVSPHEHYLLESQHTESAKEEPLSYFLPKDRDSTVMLYIPPQHTGDTSHGDFVTVFSPDHEEGRSYDPALKYGENDSVPVSVHRLQYEYLEGLNKKSKIHEVYPYDSVESETRQKFTMPAGSSRIEIHLLSDYLSEDDGIDAVRKPTEKEIKIVIRALLDTDTPQVTE